MTTHSHTLVHRTVAMALVAAFTTCLGCDSADDLHRGLFKPEAWPPVARPGDPPRPANWATPIARGELIYLARVNDGVYRGGHPQGDQLAALPEVRTVVNLRNKHSSQAAAAAAGKLYVGIPIEVWDITDDAMLQFLRVATDDRYTPIYVHCNLGSDRTGVAVAVYRMVVDGWDRDEAIREMVDGGYGFNDIWFNLVDYLRHVDADALRDRLKEAPPLPEPRPALILPEGPADRPADDPCP